MRAVVQRVIRAEVRVAGNLTGRIDNGLAVLASVAADDTPEDATLLCDKVAHLRIFRDSGGLMNRSVVEERGSVLLVSQFTLHGDARKGRRPSFAAAAREDMARPLFELLGTLLERTGLQIEYGVFGAAMEVELVNDGPVTILLDTRKTF